MRQPRRVTYRWILLWQALPHAVNENQQQGNDGHHHGVRDPIEVRHKGVGRIGCGVGNARDQNTAAAAVVEPGNDDGGGNMNDGELKPK